MNQPCKRPWAGQMVCGATLTMLMYTGPAQASPPVPTLPLARAASAFAHGHDMDEPTLSPDGSRLAYIGNVKGKRVIVVRRVDDQGTPTVIGTQDSEPTRVIWKTNNRLVAAISLAERRGGEGAALARETRLIAFNADGSGRTALIRAERGDYIPQVQDHIVSMKPDDAGHILVALSPIDGLFATERFSGKRMDDRARYPDVREVNVFDGSSQVVVPHRDGVSTWLADSSGQVRAGIDHSDARRLRVTYKAEGAKAWQEIEVQLEGSPLQPDEVQALQLTGDGGDELVLSGLGAQSQAPQRWRLRLPQGQWTPHTAPAAMAPMFTAVRGILPKAKAGRLSLDEALVRKVLGDTAAIVSASDALDVLLVSKASGALPTQWWLLAHAPGVQPELTLLSDNLGDLPAEILGVAHLVNIPTRDGSAIPGKLTLPRLALPSGQKRPFVVLVHDGPAASLGDAFDAEVQFFVSQGWSVLQPAFRGSTGVSPTHREAGRGQWGRLMQDDVTDSTKWALAKADADPERVVVAGHGYGGYAALLELAREPHLYQGAIAVAPIADLGYFREQLSHYIDRSALERHELLDEATFKAAPSPASLAGGIAAPVLLIHGRRDTRVKPVQTEVMARALQRAEVPHRVVWLADADHELKGESDQRQALEAIGGFLTDLSVGHIKPRAVAAAP